MQSNSSPVQGALSPNHKGSNFTPADDMVLADAWIEATRITMEQNTETLWDNVRTRFNSNPAAKYPRTNASLKNRWAMVQRVTQKYMSADKIYRSRSPSGETEEHIREHVMKYYRERNRVTKDGVKKLAAPIKFIRIVEKLAEHPKVSAAVGGDL